LIDQGSVSGLPHQRVAVPAVWSASLGRVRSLYQPQHAFCDEGPFLCTRYTRLSKQKESGTRFSCFDTCVVVHTERGMGFSGMLLCTGDRLAPVEHPIIYCCECTAFFAHLETNARKERREHRWLRASNQQAAGSPIHETEAYLLFVLRASGATRAGEPTPSNFSFATASNRSGQDVKYFPGKNTDHGLILKICGGEVLPRTPARCSWNEIKKRRACLLGVLSLHARCNCRHCRGRESHTCLSCSLLRPSALLR